MSYIRRLAMGLLGLFIVLMTIGVFSKADFGYYPFAAALLAMAIVWAAHLGRGRIPTWRLVGAACFGVAIVVLWQIEYFVEGLWLGLALALAVGVVVGVLFGGGVLVLVAALLGPKAERFGLSVGRSGQNREVS
jgi:hypothetical protein